MASFKQTSVSYSIAFLSFMGGMLFIDFTKNFVEGFMTQPEMIWLATHSIIFVLVFVVFPKVLVAAYKKVGGYNG